MKSPRYWTVIALLLIAALALYRRGDRDFVPDSVPLADLPHDIGQWSGADLPIDPEVLQILGKGVFLNRNYTQTAALPSPDAANGTRPAPVGLFIGYFPTQRSGQSIHSPQNCLPGAGWTFEKSGVTAIPGPGGKVLNVGEYLVTDGISTDEVLYWYQSHGRAIASDYKAKLYMLMDSARYNRTDAALVRIITPVEPGENRSEAQQRARAFAEQTVALLPAYVPD